MLNDHPNRAKFLGDDSAAWGVQLSDVQKEQLEQSGQTYSGITKGLESTLKTLGYEDSSSRNASCPIPNIGHTYLQDSKTHILVHPMPLMFDEETQVTDVALAKKCVEALDENVICVATK